MTDNEVISESGLLEIMDAQPFAETRNDATRVWQLFGERVHVGDAIKAILSLAGFNELREYRAAAGMFAIEKAEQRRIAESLKAENEALQQQLAASKAEYSEAAQLCGKLADQLAASPQQEPGAMTAEYLAATWRARADDLADEMIPGTSNKEITLLRDLADELEAELVPTPADESCASGQTLAGAGGALDAIYTDFCAKDNGDVPLERYPQGAVDALARAGWAVVPCDLPFAVLGDAAQAGVFETGNPKHGWDYLVARTRIGPNATATSAGTTGDDSEDAARFAWYFSPGRESGDALVDLMMRSINNDEPSLDEWREAIDAARRARGEG